MQRKEINIFSTSFLDLLSGALGAVLILFIIIPKMTLEQQDALDEIERLNVHTEELADLIEQARNSIPVDLYEQIQEQIRELQNTIDDLTRNVQNLQQRLQASEAENVQLRQQLEHTRRQLQDTQRQLQEAQRELERQQQQNRNVRDGKIFGTDAQLGIVCLWVEDIDVDLYVKNLASGEICYYGRKATSFGTLLEDITSRSSADDDRYELFYQQRVIPGKYLIYVNIYESADLSHATGATVDGYVVIFPGTGNEQKINYRQIRLTRRGEDVTIGTLTVTNNNITLEQ